MNKLLVLLLLGVVWAGTAEAANPTRGAKGVVSTGYSTAFSTVTAGPGVVYGVIITSGQPNVEYAVLFDSGTPTGHSATYRGASFRTLCGSASSSTTTQCMYDPPLQFNNGIVAGQASALTQTLIIYEKGRVTQGY